MSIVTSTVPALACLSNEILPDELLILPRQNDKPPPWSASNVGYVCAGSISYVTGAAAALKASAPQAKPSNVGTSFVDELIRQSPYIDPH